MPTPNPLLPALGINAGFDARGASESIANINLAKSRNALYDLQAQYLPQAQERATQQEERLQQQAQIQMSEFERGQLVNSSKLYLEAVNAGDRGAMEKIINLLPDGQIKEEAVSAFYSDDPNDDLGILNTAQAVVSAFSPQAAKQAEILSPEAATALGFREGTVVQVKPDGSYAVAQQPKEQPQGDVRDRKIANLTGQGMSPTDAANIVDGIVNMEVNEVTGKVLLTNEATGEVREVALSGAEPETPQPQVGQSLYDLADIAGGPVPSLTAKGAAAAAFFGIDTDEAATGAIQTFDTKTAELIRALSINPRFPVAEMERIQKEVNIKPSFWQAGGTLRKKMRSLDGSLRLRLDQAERDFNDPNLDVDTRQKQGANASALRNFLAVLGVPDENEIDPLTAEIQKLEEELGL